MRGHSLLWIVVLLSIAGTTHAYGLVNYNPYLRRLTEIGNTYINQIAATILTTAKNAVSNCAGATAEVANKMADHTFTALRWKRSTEQNLVFALENIESIAADYENVEILLNSKFRHFFANSIQGTRAGFQQANSQLIAAVIQLCIESTPAMRQMAETFLRQMISMSNVFLSGIENCIEEAEESSEENVNNFAQAVSQVPNSVSEDMSSFESCYSEIQDGDTVGWSDPYTNCAGGAVENMIKRVKRDVVNVGLQVPAVGFGFANIGSKASLCLMDKVYTAKSRVDGLVMELLQLYRNLGNTPTSSDLLFGNNIFKNV